MMNSLLIKFYNNYVITYIYIYIKLLKNILPKILQHYPCLLPTTYQYNINTCDMVPHRE